MYRLVLESLLGLQLEGNRLTVKPCVPVEWQTFRIHYRYRETVYHITVLRVPEGEDTLDINGSGKTQVSVDGVLQEGAVIVMTDDHIEHQVKVSLGLPSTAMLAERLV
jgi:cellobiose phosphorylase